MLVNHAVFFSSVVSAVVFAFTKFKDGKDTAEIVTVCVFASKLSSIVAPPTLGRVAVQL